MCYQLIVFGRNLVIPNPTYVFCGGFHQFLTKEKIANFVFIWLCLLFKMQYASLFAKYQVSFTFSQLAFYVKCFLCKKVIYIHVLGFLLVFEIILFLTQFTVSLLSIKCLNFPNTERNYRNFLPQLNDTYKIVSLEIFRCMFVIRI